MSHIYYTYLVLSYEHFLAAQLVILDQYSQYYLFAAPQPCASEHIPSHLEQLLTLPVECILFSGLASAFDVDFQLEEQPPQPSKVPSYVPHSQSLSEVVRKVFHLMKLMTSFVCDSLLILASLAS
jgi:hypothetical protein